MGKVQLGKEITEKQAAEISKFLQSLTGRIPEDLLMAAVLPALD